MRRGEQTMRSLKELRRSRRRLQTVIERCFSSGCWLLEARYDSGCTSGRVASYDARAWIAAIRHNIGGIEYIHSRSPERPKLIKRDIVQKLVIGADVDAGQVAKLWKYGDVTISSWVGKEAYTRLADEIMKEWMTGEAESNKKAWSSSQRK